MKKNTEIEVQDHVADYYVNKRYTNYGLKYHKDIIKGIMDGVSGKILDVGCGTGVIHDLYPNLDIIGIDVSEGMLSHHKGVHYKMSAEKILFPDNYFDAVICRSVLHHLPDCELALIEIKRVLKPGGKLVCWETNKSWLAEKVRSFTQHGDHFSEYHHSFSNLDDLIGDHYRINELRYQGFVAYPLFGFPDILDFSKFLWWLFWPCHFLDKFLSKIPVIKKLGFAILIKAVK